MTTEFITNQEKLLGDVINRILPSSQRLYFLVGYFYFSGFEEIYKQVVDKEMKMLVGLEVERDLANRIREFEIIQEVSAPRGKIREDYYRSLVQVFNNTDFFDSVEKQNAFRLFLGKIQDGSLEIRKTFQPNHAKLYIFENAEEFNQGGEYPGTVITGSSNLTRSGLRGRFEVNILSRDSKTYSEAYEIFQELWKDAVALVDKNCMRDFFTNVIERIWVDKLPKPFLMYIRVLEEFFPRYKKDGLRLPAEITRGRYINLKYQEDAIRQAIDIIQRHNGVVIADVVGLGKSIIASAVAHNLNLKAIVISPPHLMGQWEDYHNDFEFHARIYSSGKIDQALEENDPSEEKLLIIDEAHKYRNELTADYANLHQLCQRNKVMLLSATPFNNRPQDVFSMVKLFQIPTRSTIQTVDNLSYQFKDLIIRYRKLKEAQRKKTESEPNIAAEVRRIAEKIREILYPLVIRRSRLDLGQIEDYREDLKAQRISFPKVHDPEILEYELGDLSELYEETLRRIAPDEGQGGFIGARYMPANYIKNFESYREKIAAEMGVDENLIRQSQVNLADFMKRLLVRRFESSISAFRETLDSMIISSEVVLDWYERLGKVPVYKNGKLPDLDSLEEAIGDELDDKLKDVALENELQNHIENGLWLIDKKELKKAFVDDVTKDIDLLKDIYERWFGAGFPRDPKLEHFAEIIRARLHAEPHRKVVVFTEFADTAHYLFEQMKGKLRAFKYSAADATKVNRKTIKENFDAGSRIQKNDYDVLIATDAISEGFNLHRAGIVFNYDIPYNPTRVIQRVGRINRINKKIFDELFIYNFFPTATGERETRVKQISTLKIAMVHALFGEDTKVLTKDEELNSWFTKQFRESLEAQEEASPEAKYEDLIRKLRASQPEIVEQALAIPRRCRIRRSEKKKATGVIVFAKKGAEYAFKLGARANSPVALTPADALGLFEAEFSEDAQQTSEAFEAVYSEVKQNLFSKKTQVALDRGKRDAILKVEALIQKLPHKRDYLDDLLYILRELDALPDRYARFIRTISVSDLNEDVERLQKECPHSYLVGIIERERQIEEGEELLILSEELI